MFRFLLVCIVSFFLTLSSVGAADIEDLESALGDYGVAYQKNVYIGNPVRIDISPLESLLKENFGDIELEYNWDIYGQSPQKGAVLETSFDTTGTKSIQLSIYANEQEEEDAPKKLIYQSDQSIFVYEKSLALLVSEEIPEQELNDFLRDAEMDGVYVKLLGRIKENEVAESQIYKRWEEYKISFANSSNYFSIWGEKEFIFSSLSGLAKEVNALTDMKALNFVLLTNYNSLLLKNYIENNISGNSLIGKAIIIDESQKYQLLAQSSDISKLTESLEENGYEYTSLAPSTQISPYLFLSRFVNILSKQGVTTSDIYIFLLIPIFFTLISIAKHMIGISTLGNIIPIFFAVLMIVLGLPLSIGVFLFIIVINIFLSRFFAKYTLLYTPKIASITIVNLILFCLVYVILYPYEILDLHMKSVLYIVMFFVVSERLLSIITTKELREYKKSITGTLLVSLACWGLYHFEALRTFLLAYPELLLLLPLLNFYIGQFTGLRITEYLRFRDILSSEEE